jgi:uncharacterized protein
MLDTTIIGRRADLQVLRIIPHGAILDGGDLGDILLPKRYISDDLHEEDTINVFVYFDSEDRIVATTEQPFVMRDQFAFLDVKEANKVGAFMDWGLMKDLFIPFREQKATIKNTGNYLIFCYYDNESERLVGSTKTLKFLDTVPPDYSINDEVEILLVEEHELGFRCIVDHLFTGMLYANEIFSPKYVGDKMKAYVKKVREDDKIDVSLQPVGAQLSKQLKDPIVEYLLANDKVMFINDKSDPQLIYDAFGMSKKTFKKAIGHLYREKRIRILEDRITLVD